MRASGGWGEVGASGRARKKGDTQEACGGGGGHGQASGSPAHPAAHFSREPGPLFRARPLRSPDWQQGNCAHKAK